MRRWTVSCYLLYPKPLSKPTMTPHQSHHKEQTSPKKIESKQFSLTSLTKLLSTIARLPSVIFRHFQARWRSHNPARGLFVFMAFCVHSRWDGGVVGCVGNTNMVPNKTFLSLWAKWLTFCRRHFQIRFLEGKVGCVILFYFFFSKDCF